ncbi:hypothetical protein H5410_056228 [Solanum commersonii]|uniref:Uncharacterized protein n=1 Tax=Solanum commersonii TaxID=4109 RepID=A0A9J5WMH8_SOLCO|nr:hypothetical protein H5410_056228 [Solanum commersonii]
MAGQYANPWVIGRDFNVILSGEEKFGGLPVLYQELEEFANCLTNCGLLDRGYIGSTYTWWNGRTDGACIFKRLDRVLSNQKMMEKFLVYSIKH